MENRSNTNQHQTSEIQKEVFEDYTWKWFFAKEAEGLTASSPGLEYAHFMKRHFGMDIDYKKLIKSSVDEIGKLLNTDIDHGVIEELIDRCVDIRRQYVAYSQTKKEGDPGVIKTQHNKLLELEKAAGTTVKETVNQFDIPQVLGPIAMACSLHLMAIIELLPNSDEYDKTFAHFAKEYGNLLEMGAQQFYNQVPDENKVSATDERDVFLNLSNALKLLPKKHII
ncbi:hypothetical protein [Bacillus sp. CECT 9360]|uniref:hypothetical protein n=1 Tax=Bacillus sp. CECT 9360 TaxID=2845821 RepID=UPI001E34E5AC|nr:hypothetical protein [Bacillus sp. CECT 9360]CAH0343925.1 hypothetical protein BCI9360_00152 [Bacillus sp. CECT 9360]